MTQALQSMIDRANRRHAATSRRAHIKRTNDTQMLGHQEKVAAIIIDAYRTDHKAGLHVSNNVREALRELEARLHVIYKRMA